MLTFHKRRHPRRALGAKACIYAGKDAFGCVIVDMSQEGARLQLGAPATIPARFSLLVSAAEPMLECERVWQHGDTVGVKFV